MIAGRGNPIRAEHSEYSGAEMSFSRRSFLLGAGSGLSLLVLTACIDGTPNPTTSPSVSATATPGVPRPSGVQRSAWTSDPFVRGSHSFMAPGSTPQHREDLGRPLNGRVFFAGEATSTDLPGTVLGAQTSGARAAAEVAALAGAGEKIAIVGAGAAGAEAASSLSRRGFEVIVIEARDRVGGRIDSRTPTSWPLDVELGAWRLGHTADAVLLDRLAALGIETSSFASLLVRGTTGQVTVNPVGSRAIATATAWADEQPTDPNFGVALDKSGAAAEAAASASDGLSGTELLDGALAAFATTIGASASELSTWYGVGDIPVYDRVVTGGFAGVVADALTGVRTSLSTAVTGVSYRDSGVSLKLGTGESLTVDRVVLTVPLGVLKAGSIRFDPLLPFAHRAAIGALGMGSVETVWLRFDKPFWSTAAAVWSLVGTDHDITDWVNLQAVTGEPVLVGIVGGKAARRVAKLSDAQVVDAAMTALAPFAAS
jgi:monoamine oxidase